MSRPPTPDPLPTSIQGVLDALDAILDWASEEQSRLGYFAVLYKQVTQRVKDGIDGDFFDNGPRMERLDVVFANRYLEALGQYSRGESPSEVWRVAFEAADLWRPLILQQLLLGINAHINLDLGVAAAEIAPGEALEDLRHDFDRINEILFSMVAQVEHAIGEVSPWIAWLERVGGKAGDAIVRFSLSVARQGAWRLASRLAPREHSAWPPLIERRDQNSVKIARDILDPGLLVGWGLLLIRMRESSDVRRILAALDRGSQGSDFSSLEARRIERPALDANC